MNEQQLSEMVKNIRDVEKSLGIGMTKDRYFFEKVKQKWIFVRKKNLRIG